MTVTLPSTIVVGSPNAYVAVPAADPSGVDAAVLSQVALPVLVPLPGFDANVHTYVAVADPLAWTDTLLPPLTVQLPPLSIASPTLAVIASQSLGLVTVIDPLTAKLLSVPASWVTLTV